MYREENAYLSENPEEPSGFCKQDPAILDARGLNDVRDRRIRHAR
jgi:hypothetical protein